MSRASEPFDPIHRPNHEMLNPPPPLPERSLLAGDVVLPEGLQRYGGHVARSAKHFLFSQMEAVMLCPLTTTLAAVAALGQEPSLADTWIPRRARSNP